MADLVSRKPKPHTHDDSPAVEPKAIALEYKTVPEEEQPGFGTTAIDRSAEPGSEAQVEASPPELDTNASEAGTAAPVAAEALATAVSNEETATLATTQRAEQTSPAPPAAEAAETLGKPAPARRKKVEPIAESTASIGAALKEPPAAAAGPKSFTDEMADLDAEVAALRRQLAKKLIKQNAQLRKMLARFEAR
ncbi:hypothetical protein G6M50_26510 [Agrobacterium rhizogenes]|nr:hypothetical protein [Rhizobium rhizogenes]NTJ81342.1 hypothetical protein [Rhizobium rhizogenes]